MADGTYASGGSKQIDLKNYKGVQLTLIRFRDFLNYVDKDDFCCFPNENCVEDQLKFKKWKNKPK